MGDPDEPSLFQSVKSAGKALGLGHRKHAESVLPQHHNTSNEGAKTELSEKVTTARASSRNNDVHSTNTAKINSNVESGNQDHVSPSTTNSQDTKPENDTPPLNLPTRAKNGTLRFINHTKNALLHSWVNVLLVFVPIGIAVHLAHLDPSIVFAMNAVAIIPLAGLLSHATEAVAARLGDTLGALLNVSFGNAVELILFIILLAGDQIRVVQAALLGSILANLLLILGMAFLLGGLRYQEQVYNSTVTQMSACMLSLAVMSLLLPTAFHSAFSNYSAADRKTLYVSRGTSVILLLVYVLYLLFQLKSHSYMYASTPQHIIDEESHPGILADILNSSSSSESSSDSDGSNSDSSDGSHTTAKRIKRAFRNRRLRKMSTSSKDAASVPGSTRSPSISHATSPSENPRQFIIGHGDGTPSSSTSRRASLLHAIMSGDEADSDENTHMPVVRDFEAGSTGSLRGGKRGKKKHKSRNKNGKHASKDNHGRNTTAASAEGPPETTTKVAFAEETLTVDAAPGSNKRRIPVLPSLLSNNVFSNPQNPPPPPGVSALSNVRMAGPRTLRRTTSLPDRMSRVQSSQSTGNAPVLSGHLSESPATNGSDDVEEGPPLMSRTAAVVMLLISTGLVAVCADFMSSAIEPMVEKTNISQAFIGLIILPIVGNAAEHVTAVTVAAKNKMDLAIGVAVGSSIQIAIFITPFIVILGWMMNKEMSLYFNIFETIALFVTAFVVNFLVLDGRSNYLEGSLLIAAYVIIALASFFYPDGCDASQIGGQEGAC